MNTITLILYLFTWLLALLFFLLWRSEQGERIFQETRVKLWRESCDKAEERAEYYCHRFEVDEMLLKDPELRFVGTARAARKWRTRTGSRARCC